MTTITRLVLVLGLAVPLAACGEDAPPPAKKAAKKAKPKRGGGAAKKPGKTGKLKTYPKIAEEYRREFRERDFLPDAEGHENRDPFRSYVILQSGMARQQAADKVLDPTDTCTAKNSKAPEQSIRGLKLIGIVLRGTRSYALFRDSSQLGHIVRRNDCLGKEKARVEAVGAGFVRLEVTPNAPPGGKKPEPETRDIALYADEYQLDEDESEAKDEAQ